MGRLRQTAEAEMELARGLTDVDRKDGSVVNYHDCPPLPELRRLVAGKCSDQRARAILAHLGSCPCCMRLLNKIYCIGRQRGSFIHPRYAECRNSQPRRKLLGR